MKPELHCIVFDIGNVLISYRQASIFEHIHAHAEIDDALLRSLFQGHFSNNQELSLNEQYQLGLLTTDEYFDTLYHRLSCAVPISVLKEAWRCSLGEENQVLLEFIKSLHGKIKIACCSNTHDFHWQILQKELQAMQYFDVQVASHLIGLAKPDPMVYQTVASLTQTLPEQCLLIDDLEQNILAAKAQGWQSHLYNPMQPLPEWQI